MVTKTVWLPTFFKISCVQQKKNFWVNYSFNLTMNNSISLYLNRVLRPISKLTWIHKGPCVSWRCQHLAASYSPSRSLRAMGEPYKEEKMGRMEKLFGQLEGIKAWFYTPAMSTGFFQPKPFLLLIDIADGQPKNYLWPRTLKYSYCWICQHETR